MYTVSRTTVRHGLVTLLILSTSQAFPGERRHEVSSDCLTRLEKENLQHGSYVTKAFAELPDAVARQAFFKTLIPKSQLDVIRLLSLLRVEAEKGSIWYPSFAAEGASHESYSATMVKLLGEIASYGKLSRTQKQVSSAALDEILSCYRIPACNDEKKVSPFESIRILAVEQTGAHLESSVVSESHFIRVCTALSGKLNSPHRRFGGSSPLDTENVLLEIMKVFSKIAEWDDLHPDTLKELLRLVSPDESAPESVTAEANNISQSLRQSLRNYGM